MDRNYDPLRGWGEETTPDRRFLTANSTEIYEESYKGRIVDIQDADTIRVRTESGEIQSIRFRGFDAPETSHYNLEELNLRNQAGGVRATQYLRSLISEGDTVTIESTGTDKYERVLGEVITEEGTSVNKELIASGLVFPFFREGINNPQFYDPNILTPELREKALQNIRDGVGVYQDEYYRYPVHFKHGVRDNAKEHDRRMLQALGVGMDPALIGNEGVILSTNLGASYFYARAMYNNTMRQSGHSDFVVSNEDIGIATATYKLSHLIREGFLPDTIPDTYTAFDKELQTQGLGAWVNEYIGIPSGWGRIYKDELGFVPSALAAFGAAIDKSYLFYTGDQDVLGLNTIYQPLTTKSAFYQDQSFTGSGLFEHVLGAGSAFAITTISSVALYLSVGEPISLLISEGVKSNIEQTINASIPKGAQNLSFFTNLTAQASRQFTLGAGSSYLNPFSLRRDLIFSTYSLNQGRATRNNTEFYNIENFNISYYHINSIMRRRGSLLLNDLVKPFLMDVVNPYKAEYEDVFGNKIDDFISEVGTYIDLQFNFGEQGDEVVSQLFKVRQDAEAFHKRAYEQAIAAHEKAKHYKRNRFTHFADREEVIKAGDKAKGWLESNSTIDRVLSYLLDDPGSTAPLTHTGEVFHDGTSELDQYKQRHKDELVSLSTSLLHTSVKVVNAGEERQMELARKLQAILDEVPLNPKHWRIFNNESNLKSRSIVKDYKVLGDLLSFEDFTQSMRHLVLGEGGITSILDRYEVYSNTGKQGLSTAAKNIADRLHTFWNLAINGPQDALAYLSHRRKVISKIEKSSSLYKAMEYKLAINVQDGKHVPGISWANSTTSESFRSEMNRLISDEAFKKQIREEARMEAFISGKTSPEDVEKIMEKKLYIRARREALSDLDPYSRSVDILDERYLSAMTSIDRETSQLGSDAVEIAAMVADHHREQSLGILSLTSDKTFTKRLGRLKPGLGMDPTSKITKNKLMTFAFFGIAAASATESLFRSSQGVSLFTQIRTALSAGSNDDPMTLEFSGGGPLVPISGTLPRLAWSAATTATTGYAAYQIAGSLRKVSPITTRINQVALVQSMSDNPDMYIRHVARGGNETFIRSVNDLPKLHSTDMMEGYYYLEGRLSDGAEINVRMLREATDNTSKIILKKSMNFVEGRSMATAAIAFTVMSTAVMGAKATAAWTLNKTREQEKGMAPILFPVMGGAAGYSLAKMSKSNMGFGLGLVGAGIGAAASIILPSSILENFFSLGKGKNKVDHSSYTVAAELSSFISTVKHRIDTNKASKLEMMAGLYAQRYGSMLNILSGDNNRFTHVVARQSPLPFIQFFYAATTENQYRDENGNITSPGQTRITTGIQTAPILGGSFSIGLPFTITPGGGALNLTYSDKSNMLDVMAGIQTAALTLTSAAVATKMFTSLVKGTMAVVGMKNEIHNEHYIDTLLKISDRFERAGRKLVVETPFNIVGSMFKSDLDMASKILRSNATIQSHSLPSYVKSPTVQIRSNKFGKYLAASVIGGYVGGLLGSILGSEDPESMETYSTYMGYGGLAAGPLIRGGISFALNDIKMSPRINTIYRKAYINTPPLMAKAPARLTSLKKWKGLGASIALASTAAYFMTDENFGVAEGMGDHNLTRLGIMALYGAAVGTTYHHFSNSFMDASDSFRRWEHLESIRTNLEQVNGNAFHKSIARIRGYYIGIVQSGIEEDTDHMINSIKRNRNQVEMLKKYKEADTLTPLIEASDQIEIAVKNNPGESVTRRLLTSVGTNEIDELGQKVMKGRAQIVGRVDPGLAARRFYRGTKALAGFTLLFSVVASQLGGGSIEEGLSKIYGDGGLLDWGKKQGGLAHGTSNVVSSTLKLMTFMDTQIDTPGQYGEYLNTYLDRTEQGGSKGAIKRSINLVKSRNNPMSSVSELFSATEEMFILNSSNAFIQLMGPVGFTFRSGEYGKRINSYVQIQGPGADISTASYSMAAAYSFREALSGRYDSLFNLQNAVRPLKAGQPINERVLRQVSLSIISLTAKEEPLKKRRRYSSLSPETLEAVGGDPLLAHSLNYRKQMMENMSSQSSASLGTRMFMDVATNHILSDVGLLQAMFSKDPNALKTLLEDPFGILTRNPIISGWTLFQPNSRNRVKVNKQGSAESIWNEESSVQSTIREGSAIPGIGFLSNVFSSLWGSNDPLGLIKKGVFLMGTGVAALTAAHSIGSLGMNLETNQMIIDLDTYYESKLYEVSIDNGYIRAPIQARIRRGIGGQPIKGSGGSNYIELSKGNNLFLINQAFSDQSRFIKNLNKSLLDYQIKMNNMHLNFLQEGESFGQYMKNRIMNEAQSIQEAIDTEAAKLNITPKEMLNRKLKEAYGEMIDLYTSKYLDNLANTFVTTSLEGKAVNVSLLTLLSDSNAGADTLVEISDLLSNKDITPLQALKRLSGKDVSPHVSENFFRIHRDSTEELVESIVDELVNKTWMKYDSMLSQGRVMRYGDDIADGLDRHLVGGLQYINQRIASALADATRDTPVSSIKNYFGRLPTQPTIDRIRRELSRLGGILRSSRGMEIAEDAYELITTMPGVSTSRVLVTKDNQVLTQADINIIQKNLDPRLMKNDRVVVKGRGKTRYILDRSTAQYVSEIAGTVDSLAPSNIATTRARAMYKGLKPVSTGLMTAFEFGTFALDIFESVDTFGAYSRLASSYTSGSYTEAQRMTLAQETGFITTNSLIAAGIGGAAMNLGALATLVGGAVTTAVGGTAAGIAIGGVTIGAGVLGGVVLAAGAAILGLGYLMMPKEWRKKMNSTIGSAHSYTSNKIGTGLLNIGDMGKQILGSRGASATIGAIGGLLGGFIIGMGLVGLAVFSGPILATLGIAAGVGMGLGIVGGLLAPNALGSLSRTVSSYMKTIPFLGNLFNQEGDWLSLTGTSIEGSPFFTGTANQAIQLEFERHMEAAADGTAMSQLMVSRDVYGGVIGEPNYVMQKSGNLIGRITPGSQVDPTLDRELKARANIYSHSIISRYIWNSIVSNSSNKRVIREAERKYKMQQYKEVEAMEREAKAVSTGSYRRKSNGQLDIDPILVSNIMEVAKEIETSTRETKNTVVIKVKKDKLPSSSTAVAIRDLGIDKATISDLKNNISSANRGDIKISQEVDEERDFIKSSQNINTSIRV